MGQDGHNLGWGRGDSFCSPRFDCIGQTFNDRKSFVRCCGGAKNKKKKKKKSKGLRGHPEQGLGPGISMGPIFAVPSRAAALHRTTSNSLRRGKARPRCGAGRGSCNWSGPVELTGPLVANSTPVPARGVLRGGTFGPFSEGLVTGQSLGDFAASPENGLGVLHFRIFMNFLVTNLGMELNGFFFRDQPISGVGALAGGKDGKTYPGGKWNSWRDLGGGGARGENTEPRTITLTERYQNGLLKTAGRWVAAGPGGEGASERAAPGVATGKKTRPGRCGKDGGARGSPARGAQVWGGQPPFLTQKRGLHLPPRRPAFSKAVR